MPDQKQKTTARKTAEQIREEVEKEFEIKFQQKVASMETKVAKMVDDATSLARSQTENEFKDKISALESKLGNTQETLKETRQSTWDKELSHSDEESFNHERHKVPTFKDRTAYRTILFVGVLTPIFPFERKYRVASNYYKVFFMMHPGGLPVAYNVPVAVAHSILSNNSYADYTGNENKIPAVPENGSVKISVPPVQHMMNGQGWKRTQPTKEFVLGAPQVTSNPVQDLPTVVKNPTVPAPQIIGGQLVEAGNVSVLGPVQADDVTVNHDPVPNMDQVMERYNAGKLD